MDDVQLALKVLRNAEPGMIEDARVGSRVNNSVIGALLTRPLGPIGARQYAEAAVRKALRILDAERRKE